MIHLIMGAQWGDEGKGKIVDLLSQKADCVVRFHGGNNAGHTVINQYGKFPLHLIPAGIFNQKCRVFIANGTIIDLEVLIGEIEMLKKTIPDFTKRFFISQRCHVIMPYHRILDRLYEEAKGKGKTGTTGRGIGPTYADKVSYNGIRLCDFLEPKLLKTRLELLLSVKNKMIKAFGEKPMDMEGLFKDEIKKFKKIKPFVKELFYPLQKAVKENKKIIYEGAQGTFLDNDWGTYPFVTASNAVPGAINAGSGIPPQYLNEVTGVVKAYTTRVGSGPFPTELSDKNGEKLQRVGQEFGATTGRPRRCGWLDLEMVKFACQLNGFTELVITKLDVLDEFSEIKLAIGYKLNGEKINYVDLSADKLGKVKPIYIKMKGWNKPLQNIKKYQDLPKEAKDYLKFISGYTDVPISLISVGPERNQTIICKIKV